MLGKKSIAPESASRVQRYSWYALAVLLIVYIINFIDRQILAILAQDVKVDLRLDDAQLGFLYGTAFAVFYALFGVPLGRLADGWRRGTLIAIGLAFWSAMTVVSGFATSFAMLAIARMGVGIGEATAAPASYSMLSDYFPPERRATAMSIYASGVYVGQGLSLPIGGFVLSRWKMAYPDAALAPLGLAGWQAAFLAVGIPGLLVALWVLTLREPRRAAQPGSEQSDSKTNAWAMFCGELFAILPPLTLWSVSRYPGELARNLMALVITAGLVAAMATATGDWAQWCAFGIGCYAVFSWVQTLKYRDPATYRLIWGTPTVMGLLAGFGMMAFITYANTFWTPQYALRTFYEGPMASGAYFSTMTAAEEVATILGWGSAIAAAIGVIAGGVLADRWRRRHPAGRVFVVMGALLLSAPLVFAMYNTTSLSTFFILALIAVMFGSSWSGAAVATLQDIVLPRMRATAGATFILALTMVGLALGPYMVGKIATLSGNLRFGLSALYLVAPLTLVVLWRCSKSIHQTESTIAARAGEAGEAIS